MDIVVSKNNIKWTVFKIYDVKNTLERQYVKSKISKRYSKPYRCNTTSLF